MRMQRLIRTRIALALLLVIGTALPARAQIGVMTFKSIRDAESAVSYLGKLLGFDDEIDPVLSEIADNTGFFLGLDRKRRFGWYVSLPERRTGDLLFVFFVPLANRDHFMSLLDRLKWKVEKEVDGLFHLKSRPSLNAYLRFDSGYAHLAFEAEALKRQPPRLDGLISAESAKSLLAATLFVDRTPPHQLRSLVDSFWKGIEEKGQDESEIDYFLRITFLTSLKETVLDVLGNRKTVTLQVRLDQEKSRLTVDLIASGGAAATIGEGDSATGSRFAYLLDGAAIGLGVRETEGEQSIEDAFASASGDLSAFLKKSGFESFLLAATGSSHRDQILIKKGREMANCMKGNVGFALKGPFEDGTYTSIVGITLKDGPQFNRLLRDTVRDLPIAPDITTRLNHSKYKDFTIHNIEERTELVLSSVHGKRDIWCAVSEDTVFLTYGRQGLKAIRTAIDGLAQSRRASAPVEVRVSLRKAAFLYARNDTRLPELRQLLETLNDDVFAVRLTAHAGPVERWRLQLNPNSLQLFKAVMELTGKTGGETHRRQAN